MGDNTASGGKNSGGSSRAAPPPLAKSKTTGSPPLGRGIVKAEEPIIKEKIRPLDAKGALEFDIEQERERTKQMEDNYRKELDKLRHEQQRAVGELEADHIIAKK